MVLVAFYQSLAQQGDIATLIQCGRWDERVYHIVDQNPALMQRIIDELPDAGAARFLARGSVGYENFNTAVFDHFVPIASLLARYETAMQGSALADLLSTIPISERHRLDLFNFSESFRHLILSRNLFAQRATVRCLSYMFCDDFLADAVAVLQHKTDILNHVNRIFVDTPDLWSWRFSVRAMSLAGGYNEDQLEVDKTERFCYLLTRVVPEFLMYSTIGFAYGLFRHYPRRMRGTVPKWLRRHRAYFTAAVTGLCGIMPNSVLDWRTFRARQYFDLRKEQEMRRRNGATRRGLPFKPNRYYDDTSGITASIWWMQAQHYLLTASMVGATLIPLRKITYPGWMGDVPWRYPFIPRLLPMTLGMPCASRGLVPFTLVPFMAGSAIALALDGTSLFDYYVHLRYRWWKKYRASE